ncbi:MAG: type II toxin-antitoxin system RelE/ParE family toxin [Chloroflexota bacterium]|nr:type II toxin-antitoxin system RelE/ParE family toxin [Chloroflexota bacterium]
MSYHVEVVRSAQRAAKRLPAEHGSRIARAILALSDDPRPAGCRKLSASDIWRLRVGEYRVLYTISDTLREVMVQRIERRTTHTYD